MTRTNVIFSAVDFVENLRKALGYPYSTIMEEKVKGMFDDAGFADFTDKLRVDTMGKIFAIFKCTLTNCCHTFRNHNASQTFETIERIIGNRCYNILFTCIDDDSRYYNFSFLRNIL